MLNTIIPIISGICLVVSFTVAIKTLDEKKTVNKLRLLTVKSVVPFLVVLVFGTGTVFAAEIYRSNQYEMASQLLNEGDFSDARMIYDRLGDYEMVKETQYQQAQLSYVKGDYFLAHRLFSELGGYKKSSDYLTRIALLLADYDKDEDFQKSSYEKAKELFESEQYYAAMDYFKKLVDYKDSALWVERCETLIRGLSAKTISAGIRATVAITNDNRIKASTENHKYDYGDWTDIISVSNTNVIVAGLKSDGTVVTTGEYEVNTNDWTDIVAISAGERYLVGLKSDGTLVGTGHDMGDGQLAIQGWSNIVAIATGWRHTVGLDSDGKIHITGYGSSKQLKQIASDPRWTDIIAVAAGGGGEIGEGHTVGLRSDGTVVAVGDNKYRQCNVEDWTNIVAIAAGDWHTVGLRADGTVVSTRPDEARYPNLYLGACDVDQWQGIEIIDIEAGTGYTVGLTTEGQLMAIGFNDDGKCTEARKWKNLDIHIATEAKEYRTKLIHQ